MALRMYALVWWFFLGELRGLLRILLVWVLSGGPFARDTPARRRALLRHFGSAETLREAGCLRNIVRAGAKGGARSR